MRRRDYGDRQPGAACGRRGWAAPDTAKRGIRSLRALAEREILTSALAMARRPKGACGLARHALDQACASAGHPLCRPRSGTPRRASAADHGPTPRPATSRDATGIWHALSGALAQPPESVRLKLAKVCHSGQKCQEAWQRAETDTVCYKTFRGTCRWLRHIWRGPDEWPVDGVPRPHPGDRRSPRDP